VDVKTRRCLNPEVRSASMATATAKSNRASITAARRSLNYFVSTTPPTRSHRIARAVRSCTTHEPVSRLCLYGRHPGQHSSVKRNAGISNDRFQIQIPGLEPDAGFVVNGQRISQQRPHNATRDHRFASSAIFTARGVRFSSVGFFRYSSLAFEPDDWRLLYNGIAQSAFKSDKAYGAKQTALAHRERPHNPRGAAVRV